MLEQVILASVRAIGMIGLEQVILKLDIEGARAGNLIELIQVGEVHLSKLGVDNIESSPKF